VLNSKFVEHVLGERAGGRKDEFVLDSAPRLTLGAGDSFRPHPKLKNVDQVDDRSFGGLRPVNLLPTKGFTKVQEPIRRRP
jgi:hypothetical protein